MGQSSCSNFLMKEEEMISEKPPEEIYKLNSSSVIQSKRISLSSSNPNIFFQDDELNNNNKKGKICQLNEREASAISYENKIVGETIVKVEISESEEKNTSEFIIIMDISESMGDYVPQIINNVIPKVLDKLNYDDKKYCHLITFSNESKVYHLTKKDFKTSGIKAYGNTQMLGVVQKLKDIIESINQDEFINILSISDGKVQDRDNTNQNLELLLNEMKIKNKNINSQAIRFISSKGADPDTRLLCSLLKFNSDLHIQDNYLPITFDPKNEIMNEETIEEFSDIIYKIFHIKKSGWKIVSDSKNMRIEPFGEKYDKLELPEGKSILFIDKALSELPDINLCSTSGESKSIDFGGEVDKNNVNDVYKEAFENIIGEVLRNKISGTKESIEKNKNLIEYVEQIGNINEEDNQDNNLVNVLREINNDKNVKNMDENQINIFMNTKKDECKKELDILVKKDFEINLNKKNDTELFLILDSCEIMEKHINNLIKNILYKAILRMGFNDNNKIRVIGFCDEDLDEVNFKIKNLKNHEISCMGKRKLYDCLYRVAEIITKENKKSFVLLFLFSGEIIDKEIIRKVSYKMSELGKKIKIISRIIKYNIDKSDFPKNKNNQVDNSKEDFITYGLIHQINTEGMNSCKTLIINEKDSDEIKINNIVKLFRKNN